MQNLLDKDLKYIDSRGSLYKSRTELFMAKMLTFLGIEYQYDARIISKDGTAYNIDFKIQDRYIEVIDSAVDLAKFEKIRSENPHLVIVAVGHSKFNAKVEELDSLFIFDENTSNGSIFIEDPSLSFDYAHILPLVDKCSILHGHTSTVMVEIIGKMKNNLVIDFGEAKKIIKETLSTMDHKFFINRKYLKREDRLHYYVSFEGPKGYFNLQLPRGTTFLLTGEATVENLASEIISLLAPKMPDNIEGLGIYIYEGVSKGAHVISRIRE